MIMQSLKLTLTCSLIASILVSLLLPLLVMSDDVVTPEHLMCLLPYFEGSVLLWCMPETRDIYRDTNLATLTKKKQPDKFISTGDFQIFHLQVLIC